MGVKRVEVQRFSLISKRPFDEVVRTLEAAIGRPDMRAFGQQLATARAPRELEGAVQKAVGPADLMEFIRFDVGQVLRLYHGAEAGRSLRLVVGNPLIMRQVAEQVPDAASYAPVTLLVDERADGVHLSYDRMASFLADSGSRVAIKVAQDLDAKVEKLLTEACG